MNIADKAGLLVWYFGEHIKQGAKKLFNLSVSDPKAWNPSLWNLWGTRSASGEIVTEETALTYSAYWNAINLISGTIGSLPCNLMQQQDRGARIYSDIPAYSIMHDRWNPLLTAKVGRQTITAHVLGWGNGFAEKVFNNAGDLIELWPIPPNRFVRLEIKDFDFIYYFNIDGEIKPIPRKYILHLKGPSPDGYLGYSIAAIAMKSLGLAMAMETYGCNFFKRGINPSGIVESDQPIEDTKTVREALQEVYSGLGKSHRLMLLESGLKYRQLELNNEESQFLESRQFHVTEVARWFNLPPHKLKDLTKSSFNNIEQEQISFVTDSILPWLIDFEQEFKLQLLTDRQRRQGLYFNHIVEGLLRADAKSRGEYYQLMRRNGIMTPNEIRAKEDMNPSDDPMADELWTEVNMVPYSKVGEVQSEQQQQLPGQTRNLIELKVKQGE